MLRSLTRRWLPRALSRRLALGAQRLAYPPDFTDAEIALVESVAPFTMTSPERVVALADAVRYVVAHRIPGALVECGVWRGGSAMVMARALMDTGAADRELALFDTFEGMTPPGAGDSAITGEPASHRARWLAASAEEVRANVARTGYPMERVRLVAGRVEETLPAAAPAGIALLRLDTDWYESTRHEMETLYPRLSPGGVLLVDDYGHWQGARRAVDEYFAAHPPAPLLQRVDYTGRLAIKA